MPKDRPVDEPEEPRTDRKRYDINFRSFAKRDSKNNKLQHVLKIRSKNAKKTFDLVLRAGTEDSLYGLDISRAIDKNGNIYKIDGNEIKNIVLGLNGFVEITVEFDSNEKYSLTADAYENK
jgi:hypothetical protein